MCWNQNLMGLTTNRGGGRLYNKGNDDEKTDADNIIVYCLWVIL
jgi:hypothetical protein